MSERRKIKTLIIDDSAMVRKILSVGLSEDEEIEVIGTASDPQVAMQILAKQRPDVITLDLEMPNMDGLTFLRSYMKTNPIPTVVISSQTQRSAQATVDALAAGAVDVIAKPRVELGGGLGGMMHSITSSIKVAARARVSHHAARAAVPAQPVRPVGHCPNGTVSNQPGEIPNWMFVIGSSTGGVQAVTRVLSTMPRETPPILIVQHMPEGFTRSFAERLNQTCAMQVKEAEDGDLLENGRVLIAPGGERHMIIAKYGPRMGVKLIEGPQVCFSRPAVDVLFRSVAARAGGRVSAVILTGMGRDGAEGQLAIRQSGGRTVAQDEASCSVFGMPGAAAEIGAAETLVPLDDVSQWLMNTCPRREATRGQEVYRV